MRIRKQVYELTQEDFAQHPVWEFALDEEGEEGQDEATVRPRSDLSEVTDCSQGDFVVATEFHLRDGSQFRGFVYAREEKGLGSVQPVIITDQGQLAFWHGAIRPEPGELRRAYELLGRLPDRVFPIRFHSLVVVGGGPIEGIVPGFLYLDDDLQPVEER